MVAVRRGFARTSAPAAWVLTTAPRVLLTAAGCAAMCRQMEKSEAPLARLVAAAHRGDQDSRGALLAIVRPAVLRYALARGLPDADAHDLAQDTCLALLTALQGWREQGRPVWALVFTIARNKLAD